MKNSMGADVCRFGAACTLRYAVAVPVYEYRCDDCGAAFEKFVRHPDRETVCCPACGCERITQQVSQFGFPTPGKLKEPYRGPHKEDFTPPVHDD